MKILSAMTVSFALLGAASASAQSMQVTPNGATPSVIAPAENFSGTATVTPLFPGTADTHATGGLVNFTPGARSAWHTHPAGQLLIITSGTGWVQEEGQAKVTLKPGDVVWTPPGVKHWHGATATDAMAHIAISYMRDGKNVTWMEKVTDGQYEAK